jgi:4'-phosphopantetheinyl transferase
MTHTSWAIPPYSLALENDEVHIWRVQLDMPEDHILALEHILASDERTRATRFHFPKDRLHFIAARGVLRTILGRYLAQNPSVLQFRYNQYGKPFLYNGIEDSMLSFNVTHSHNMALYAITRKGREVGIDIEYIRPERADLAIAEHFFSHYEVKTLCTIPAPQQALAFFHCWTRKEAYIKARGMGLSLDLSLFDVSLMPGEPAEILNTREQGQDLADWSLHDLAPGSGYAAALAAKGAPYRLVSWQWPGIPG